MNPTGPPSELAWSRLILWRPRPAFPLPAGWPQRACIPLGELRPLLQAVSPVRDLSDIWRWVAEPIPLTSIELALAAVARVESQPPESDPAPSDPRRRLSVRGLSLIATFVLAPPPGSSLCERIELTEEEQAWFRTSTPEAAAAMLEVAGELRRACGCVVVTL